MKIESMRIGQEVRHPHHGVGVVKALNEHTAEIQFTDGRRTVSPGSSELLPAGPQASIQGLEIPLAQLVGEVVDHTLDRLGLERPDSQPQAIGARWRGGRLELRPADPSLQSKTLELDVFFHKIVMMRNNLRVLEQKVNASEILSSADKLEWQQYITRCYGSMTSFNILFKDKEDQF